MIPLALEVRSEIHSLPVSKQSFEACFPTSLRPHKMLQSILLEL